MFGRKARKAQDWRSSASYQAELDRIATLNAQDVTGAVSDTAEGQAYIDALTQLERKEILAYNVNSD